MPCQLLLGALAAAAAVPTGAPAQTRSVLGPKPSPALASVPAAERQEAPPDPASHGAVPLVDEVVVTAQTDVRESSAASRLVIKQDELTRFGDTVLSESLKRLPGVTVESDGALALRGLASGYTQVLIDGQRAPTGFSVDSLSPESVERIEIVRSSLAEHGPGGIAGTINIILKKAARAGRGTAKLGIAGRAGKLEPNASWQRADARGDLSYSLVAAADRRGFVTTRQSSTETGLSADGDLVLVRTGSSEVDGWIDTASLTPSATWKLPHGSVSLNGLLSYTGGTSDTAIRSETTVGRPLPYAQNPQFTDTDSLLAKADLRWQHDFSRFGELDAVLNLTGSGRDRRFRETGVAPDGAVRLDDTVDSQEREYAVTSKGKHALPPIGGHSFAFGWEGGLTWRTEDRIERFGVRPDLAFVDSDLVFDAEIRRFAIFAQDEWRVTPRWSLYLGIRGEHVATRSEGNNFGVVEYEERVFSPVLQSLWKLSADGKRQVRAAMNRTYRLPRAEQLIPRPYTSGNNQPFDPDTQGNPALRAELATGLDVSYEHHWAGEAVASVGAYVRRINDVIRDELLLRDGRYQAYPINDGPAAAWGVEMDAKLPIAKLIKGAPAISLNLNLTANWSEIENLPGPDARIEGQVPLSATVGADYRRGPNWTMGGSFTYREGGVYRTTPVLTNLTAFRREFDVFFVRNLLDSARLRGAMNNLLEADLVSGAVFLDESATLRRRAVRESPLAVRLGFERDF